MSRSNLSDNRTYAMRLGPQLHLDTETSVQTTGFQIDPLSAPVIFLNPAGAINVQLPASSGLNAAKKGQVFFLVNLSGSIVTVQTSGGAAFATAITVAANGATRVICTGNATANLGWVIW